MDNNYYKVYIGIDVHRRQHKVAILPIASTPSVNLAWNKLKIMDISNKLDDFEILHNTIKKYSQYSNEAIIAVDHTGGHYSEPLVYFLQRKNYNVCHLEPKAVKLARDRLLDQEGKSDTIDATCAAYLLYLRDTQGLSFRISAIVPELGGRASILRSLILQRQQYVKTATQVTNRLHQFLLSIFPEAEAKYFTKLLRIIPHYPTPEDIVNSHGLKGVKYISTETEQTILKLASNTIGVPGKLYRDIILVLSRQREDALARCKSIDKFIEKEVITHPYGATLLSFPCIGLITAATVISVVNDINRWPDKKKLKKALGIYGVLRQSGARRGKYRLGKEGSKHARSALFRVVSRCIQEHAPNSDFKDYYLRQVGRGKPKLKALFSTMGKLAEVIYHCLKTGELYEYRGIYQTSSRIRNPNRKLNPQT